MYMFLEIKGTDKTVQKVKLSDSFNKGIKGYPLSITERNVKAEHTARSILASNYQSHKIIT